MKRMTCSFPDALGLKIEKMAEESGMPQTAVVSMAVKEYFDQKEMISNLPKLLQLGENLAKMEVETAKKMIQEIGINKLE